MSRTSSDGTELIFTVVLTLTRGLVYSSSRGRSSPIVVVCLGTFFSSSFLVEGKTILEVVHYCDIQDKNRLHTGDTSLKQINFIPRGETELARLSALLVLRIPHSVLLHRRE